MCYVFEQPVLKVYCRQNVNIQKVEQEAKNCFRFE